MSENSEYVPQPDDDEPLLFSYASSRANSFRGQDESGYTKGAWRQMSMAEQDEAINEYLNNLVDVYTNAS